MYVFLIVLIINLFVQKNIYFVKCVRVSYRIINQFISLSPDVTFSPVCKSYFTLSVLKGPEPRARSLGPGGLNVGIFFCYF